VTVADAVFAEKIRTDGTVTTEDAIITSPQKSDGDEMPKLSPPDVNFKLRATMPDLLHSST